MTTLNPEPRAGTTLRQHIEAIRDRHLPEMHTGYHAATYADAVAALEILDTSETWWEDTGDARGVGLHLARRKWNSRCREVTVVREPDPEPQS